MTGCVPGFEAPLPPQVVEVVSIADGDSFRATIEGSEVEVRMDGLNAPELDECFGAEAKEHLGEAIGEGLIELTGNGEVDQFDRLLATVLVGGSDINLLQVESGHAIATSDGSYGPAQDSARQGKVGLWSPDSCGAAGIPIPPLVITEVDYDPADGDETVTIRNQGADPINLSGFVLRDESSVNRYQFPGSELTGAGVVIVHTGCGEDKSPDLHWCNDQPVWNNDGDMAILLDPYGRVVAVFQY